MKRNVLLAIAFGLLSIGAKAQAPDWGDPDTLEHYSLATGIEYTKIAYSKKPVVIWLTTVDLSNPYTEIRQVQSHDKVPDVSRETVMSMSKRYTTLGHKVCAAFNHDFFSYDQGICIGVNVTDGEISYGSGWGRSMIAVSEDRHAGVFYPKLEGNVVLKDGSKVKIDFFNSSATSMPGNCILFNSLNARNLSGEGLYIQLKPKGKWLLNSNDISCEVIAVSTAPLQTSATECVLYARNEKIASFENKIQVGDEVSISQKFIKEKFGTPLNNIIAGFHGYPSIAFEGQLHDGEYNDFENGREYEVSARVMAGTSQDGTLFYIATVEGGTVQSPGVNCIDLAHWMIAHGAWNVVNFDSGGSATIAVEHTMLNYPMRGSIRPVTDALLAVSTAPESSEIESYAFLTPSLYATSISLSPLTLLAFNPYGQVLERGVQGFTYECIPHSMGYVDEDGVFHASTQSGKGKIIARKDGKQAVLNVYISEVNNVKITEPEILLDGNRTYPIGIEAVSGAQTYPLDAGAFNWTSSNPGCCTVENGVARGLSEGEALLEGMLEDLYLAVKVKVEMASGEKVHDSFSDITTWTYKTTGTFTNVQFEYTNLPIGWGDGVNMLFDVNTGRSASLELNKSIPLYSLPDSISFQLDIKDDLVKELYVDFSSKKHPSFLKTKITPEYGKDSVYVISFMNGSEPLCLTEYPITFNGIKLYMKSGKQYTNSRISFRDLKAYYPGKTPSGFVSHSLISSPIYIEKCGDEAILHYALNKTGQANIHIYNIEGSVMMNEMTNRLLAGSYEYRIPLYRLSKGIYLIHVVIGDFNQTIKFVVE